MIRPIAKWSIVLAIAILVIVGAVLWGSARLQRDWSPDPQVIAQASLQGLREQSRLSALVASYVAVTTARQSRFGLKAERTLIMPGTVRYEVDLAKLGPESLRWNAATGTLDIIAPPVEVTGPEVDLARVRQYDGGGLLLAISDTGQALDAANRRAGVAELLRQAREPVPMSLAKDATRRAIERSFALPLRAAGLDAQVRVRFPDEPGFRVPASDVVDRSRAVSDVYTEPAGR